MYDFQCTVFGACSSALTNDAHAGATRSTRLSRSALRLLTHVILTLPMCPNLRMYVLRCDFAMSFYRVQRLEMS